jgi:pilus assembly protein Flp/PilA
MLTLWKRFASDERGATMVEYGLLVALIAVAAMGAIGLFGIGVAERLFGLAIAAAGG